MSITTRELKEEILQHPPHNACCQKIALATFLHSHLTGSELIFSRASTGRFLIQLLNELKITDWGMGISKKGITHAGTIIFGKEMLATFPIEMIKGPLKNCCGSTLLKTRFALSGSLSAPKNGYHLEISCHDKELAEKVNQYWKRFGCKGILFFRRGKWVAVLKSGESIALFMSAIGAHHTLLRFEEIRAVKETKNEIRRHVNYESANVERMVNASQHQKKMIETLMNTPRWRYLSNSLKEVANARLKYPNLSLVELAKKLGISKSALNHRFRRLNSHTT